MTRESMLAVIRGMTGETDCGTLNAYLDLAEAKVLERCYPFAHDQTEVPTRYQSNVIEIAAYLLDKRGASGETAHSENGISRSYESASVPDSMLASVIPFAKVV